MSRIEIKTRFKTLSNGDRGVRLTVKCDEWRFWHDYNFIGADLDYLKSEVFKEDAYNVFSKYEGMTYDEMRNTDRTADFQKIGKRLGVCYPTDEQFKIGFHTKLIKTYGNGLRFKFQFGNNIDNRAYYWSLGVKTGFDCRYDNYESAYVVMNEFESMFRKHYGDSLDKYTSWDEFVNDKEMVDMHVEAVQQYMLAKYSKSAA